MSSYTKGTFADGTTGWKVGKINHTNYKDIYEIHFSDSGECIAEMVHGKANADLIEAAPKTANQRDELLETLTGLLENYHIVPNTTYMGPNHFTTAQALVKEKV